MTWPIAARMSSMGRVDSTDAMYAMWNIAWVARALTSNPSQIFNANIFYPHENTLAFSESNLLTGAFGIPAWLLTKDVYATYNFVTLVGFALSFICTYALAKRLTGSRTAATVAAIGYAFCPYVYARFPHIQLQMTFGLPLSMLALHRVVDRPTWGRGAALGGALAAQGLTCAYYGILAGLSVGLGVIFFAFVKALGRDKRYWIAVGVAFATCVLLIAPVFIPYLTLHEVGFRRTLEEAARHSFGWRSWLASAVRTHEWMLPWLQAGGWRGGVLFPGFVTSIAGLAGLILAIGKARGLPEASQRKGWFYLLVGGMALCLSLGPDAGLYTLLYYTVPVFQLLRAPERFGIAVMLALSIGSAYFTAWLLARLRGAQAWRAAQAAIVALLALSIADKWIAPLQFRDALPVPSPYRMLARLPDGPVAEFPYFFRQIDLHRHAHYMFFSTYHWHPLINGYSDHIPAAFRETAETTSRFPSLPAFAILRERGARYVVVYLNWFHRDRRPEVEQGLTHFTAQGVLRFLDKDKKLDHKGEVLYDVVLYEILTYPQQPSTATLQIAKPNQSRLKQSRAAKSVSSFLQKQKRSLERPSDGSR